MIVTSFESLNAWQASLDALTNNVKVCVRQCRRQGTIAMSRANLRQIVPTNGVHVAPAAFDRLLDQAIERAGVAAFVRGGE